MYSLELLYYYLALAMIIRMLGLPLLLLAAVAAVGAEHHVDHVVEVKKTRTNTSKIAIQIRTCLRSFDIR